MPHDMDGTIFPTSGSILGTALLIALVCAALTGRAQPLPQQPPAQSHEVIIRGGWVFNGVGDARVRNTGILVRSGKFIEVGVDLAGRDLSRARVVDLDDTATVLPGMFDLHAHYNMSLGGEGRVEEAIYNPIVFLANGATSTFAAGEYFPDRMIEARDMAMDALEAALKEAPRADHRHRIEHLGGSLDEARLARAKRLGVIPVPTPGGTLTLRAAGRDASGPRRLPYRTLLAMGFRPPGNSDTAGTRTDLINPWPNIYGLVTRTNRSGVAVDTEEALSVTDALRVYSLFGAYAGFEEKIKGSLEPGKLADLVVLSEDPLSIPPARLKDVLVDATIIDGVVRYERH